ncbi:hypothetical protein ALC57_14993, partial [Trachymyrmex cornetzi]
VSVSHSAQLSHTVGKSWLFSLKSCNFVADVTCSVVPHAEKLPGGITASVGTVENARDRSSRERVTDAYAPPGLLGTTPILWNKRVKSKGKRIGTSKKEKTTLYSTRVRGAGEGEGEGAWTCARATAWNSQHWLREGAWWIEGVSHRPSAQRRAPTNHPLLYLFLSRSMVVEKSRRRILANGTERNGTERKRIELNGNGNGIVDSEARNHHVTARQMFPTSFREIPPPSMFSVRRVSSQVNRFERAPFKRKTPEAGVLAVENRDTLKGIDRGRETRGLATTSAVRTGTGTRTGTTTTITIRGARARRRVDRQAIRAIKRYYTLDRRGLPFILPGPMILKDKRRKPSKEDFAPRNRSKIINFAKRSLRDTKLTSILSSIGIYVRILKDTFKNSIIYNKNLLEMQQTIKIEFEHRKDSKSL